MIVLKMKTSVIVSITAILFAGCMASPRQAVDEQGQVSIPTVFTRYLGFPTPSHDIAAEFNPPVLRWPVAKGKEVTYDVRLSMDSLYDGGHAFSMTATPWAMFNPHQRLGEGTWYWQYRVSGKEWSPVQQFRITRDAVDMVTPPVAHFLEAIPRQHPRVLAERSDLPRLRALREDADAGAIIAEAQKALGGRIPSERDGIAERAETDEDKNRKLKQDASSSLGSFVFRTVTPLCQAWMLTGEEAYRQRAIAIAREVATWDPNGVTGSAISDFSDARCMLAMALVFDTFYEALPANDRALLRNAVHARASGFYASWINNQEARLLSGHVWQHILHYFFQTALAMQGDEPDAENWLAYAYELFLARTPILGGKDGGWAEGVSYFRMNMETVIDIPLFIKRYTGFDFINTHPWYENNVDWLIYHIPPGSSADGFGDNTEEVFSPGAEYVAFAHEVAKLTGSAKASWYVSECRRYERTDLSSFHVLRWIRLTKTRDLVVPPVEGKPQLASGRLFRDIGLVSLHSRPDNTAENLAIALRSSPFGCYGHFLADHNAFNILYGGKRTFFRTGYKVTMKDPHRTGWYQHTKSNNSVLINGEGQPYSTEAFGWIPKLIEGKDIVYALADASNAYSSQETNEDYGVKRFHRHLVLLKPDIIVIYDELEAAAPAAWSWLIHSMEKINTDDHATFHSDFGNVRGEGRLWSSVPIKLIVTDTFDVPAVNWRGSRTSGGKLKTYDDEQWHLKAVTADKSHSNRFLAIIRFSDHREPAALSARADRGGVTVTADDWEIAAVLDNRRPASLVIRRADGSSGLVTDPDTLTLQGASLRPEVTPAVVEMRRGKARWITQEDAVPWQLEQSIRYYSNMKKENIAP